MSKISALAALTLAVIVSMIGVAHAAYPPAAPTVGVSDSTVQPGQTITVTGDRWEAGTAVALSFHSAPVPLGTATVRPDGTFSARVTIPSDATAGTHEIIASGTASNGRPRSVSTTVTVLGDVVTAPGSTAFTGAHLQVWMVAALILFVIGMGLVVAARRRTHPSA